MKLKICGLKYKDNILEVASLKPDYIGFIFYTKSQRYVTGEWRETIGSHLKHIKKVGVFVNASREEILEKVKHYMLDFVQLHGDESPEFCDELSREVKIIKAFGLNETFDFTVLEMYETSCSFFLFDTQSTRYGGSGTKFNWTVLKNYTGQIPFFLSGGIGLEDIEAIKQLSSVNIHAVDVNSKFETAPGMKDTALLRTFIEAGEALFMK